VASRSDADGFPAGLATQELVEVAHAWDRAMTANDAAAIGRFMADDWIIIGSDGSVTDKAAFLDLVESGIVSHDVMTSENIRVRVYGDAAVVTADGVSAGKYLGQPFREVERASSVFVKQSGTWRCVLTHLSRLPS
jgi:ketosteroid isomerase-like protein